MMCERCAECPIEKYCDMVDEIVSNQGDLESSHDLPMAIYSAGVNDVIKYLKSIGIVLDEEIVVKKIQEQKNE